MAKLFVHDDGNYWVIRCEQVPGEEYNRVWWEYQADSSEAATREAEQVAERHPGSIVRVVQDLATTSFDEVSYMFSDEDRDMSGPTGVIDYN
jgi:hypothetical protein